VVIAGDTLPDLVPARMVNEYCYCPRLFHLEWVQAQFADSVDTVDGRWQHRVVDEVTGLVPTADEGDITVARSVMLSSEKLGLVGKADLLEGDDHGGVVPVDYKRGSPPDLPERAYLPERVQLCVLGILLRENGYRCDKGVLYFASTRERVEVVFDDELVAATLQAVLDLRKAAIRPEAPPPLVDSPKCPRCSLVGICLPDETNLLASRADQPPRRLVPRDPDPSPLYLVEQGARASKRKGRIEIKHNGEKVASIRTIDVSQVCVYGNVQLSTQLIRDLLGRDIPISWFSYGGWFSGMASGLPSKNVELRRRQVAVAHQGHLDIARRVVNGKIMNSRTMLRRNSRQKPGRTLDALKVLADKAMEADSIASLLGTEGAAARLYFGDFAGMIRSDQALPGRFSFDGRKRRPPPDAVNCLLGYLYGLLAKELTTTTHGVGFDPYLGFYHRPRFGRPALALDLAEEFRPLVAESVALTLINNGEVAPSDFLVRAGGVALTTAGKKSVLRGYERRMNSEVRHPVFGYRITYRRVLEVQARLLAAYLLGEVPNYQPFVTR